MRARKKGGDREPLIIRERHVQAFQHLQSQPVQVLTEIEPSLVRWDGSE